MYVEWIDKNTVRIKVESDNDLFSLFKIINPGDIIEGYDYRTIKISETKKEKIKVWIKLEAESVKFSEYGDFLRVSGKILEASEIVSGRYHTFNIRIGSEFKLSKKKWTNFEIKELENAQKSKKDVVVVSVDDREISLGVISNRKIKIIEDIKVDIPLEEKERESMLYKAYSEIIKKIEELSPKVLFVIGPIFYPENFVRYLKQKIDIPIKIYKVSKGGRYGIYEFLKRKEYLDSIKSLEIIETNKKIQDFLLSMLKGLAVFGLEKVSEMLDIGNVEYILISVKFFKKLKESGNIENILSIMKKAESIRADVFFVYEQNENFELIDKFGIAAKLRYKID